MSISSTFYAHIFCTNFLPKQNVTRHVTREKLPKQRSYEKFVHLMSMKLTPYGVKLHFTKTNKENARKTLLYY
jgi:hypothetical protein